MPISNSRYPQIVPVLIGIHIKQKPVTVIQGQADRVLRKLGGKCPACQPVPVQPINMKRQLHLRHIPVFPSVCAIASSYRFDE